MHAIHSNDADGHDAYEEEDAMVNAMHAMRLAAQHDDVLATLPDTIDDDDDAFVDYYEQQHHMYSDQYGQHDTSLPVNPWENSGAEQQHDDDQVTGTIPQGGTSAWAGGLPAHLRTAPQGASPAIAGASPPTMPTPAPPPAAALQGLCPAWFVAGRCQRGQACTLVHGDQCEVCGVVMVVVAFDVVGV